MAQSPALAPRLKRLSELDPAGPLQPSDLFAVVQPAPKPDDPDNMSTRKGNVQQFVALVGSLGGNAVTSVAGKQGIVTLGPDDITGLGLYVDNHITAYEASTPPVLIEIVDGGNF